MLKSIVLIMVLFLSGCKEDYQYFPSYPVDLTIDVNSLDSDLPRYMSKRYIQGTPPTPTYLPAYIKTGLGGIVVVVAADNQYYAFDLSCPVELKATTRVGAMDKNYKVKCPVCGSVYELTLGIGNPTEGTANKLGRKLQRYSVRQTGNGTYRIY